MDLNLGVLTCIIEQWRWVPHYEGLYLVSSMGKVARADYIQSNGKGEFFVNGHIMRVNLNRKGYPQICLTKNNQRDTQRVHRLVALAFIPNPNNLPTINHKNEDKTDNRVENLEWCSWEYNHNYGTRNRRQSKSMVGKNCKRIPQLDLNGNVIKEWASALCAAIHLGICQTGISLCCTGRIKTYKKYKWKFVYDDYVFLLPKKNYPKYDVGEVVAVAQSYKDILSAFSQHPNPQLNIGVKNPTDTTGWHNKMFVKPNLMPHHIKINDVKVERLQDISDETSIKEGIRDYSTPNEKRYGYSGFMREEIVAFRTPREAFASLIDKVSGKGTWESNPYVFVYDFELVK